MSKQEYTIYGTQGCYECTQAKKLLETKGLPLNYIDAPTSLFFQNTFVAKGIRKVPQIYVTDSEGNEKHIGGYLELVREVMNAKR